MTILHRGERPLETFEPDLVDLLVEATRAVGIDVRLGHEVIGVRSEGACLQVVAEAHGKEHVFYAGLVVHGAGRVPQIDDMDLESGNVKYSRRGVRVNDYLQSTSNPRV